jgi:hypothetical protein
MRTRKMRQESFPLRTEIENDVVAFNNVLKRGIKCMPLYELLCNCHPLYRADYARKLQKEDRISETVMKEFTSKQPLHETI